MTLWDINQEEKGKNTNLENHWNLERSFNNRRCIIRMELGTKQEQGIELASKLDRN